MKTGSRFRFVAYKLHCLLQYNEVNPVYTLKLCSELVQFKYFEVHQDKTRFLNSTSSMCKLSVQSQIRVSGYFECKIEGNLRAIECVLNEEKQMFAHVVPRVMMTAIKSALIPCITLLHWTAFLNYKTYIKQIICLHQQICTYLKLNYTIPDIGPEQPIAFNMDRASSVFLSIYFLLSMYKY